MAIVHKMMTVDGIGSLVRLFGIRRKLKLRSGWNRTGKVETEPARVTSHLKMNDRFIVGSVRLILIC
ncbi:3-dehydroquinate synthase [Trichinella spiralis]|uniref:3-dehydroquinate synthase n=1 Tax=Trichinella spiralis TaxID=6334 RepID=A0ABR3KYJ1_TRISP